MTLKFLPVPDILNVSTLSLYWRGISQKDPVWKPVFANTFPDKNDNAANHTNYKELFIKAYKEEREIRWDENFNARITITENGKRAKHTGGTKYLFYF